MAVPHASGCGRKGCEYPNCLRIRGLFVHGMRCELRVPGNCSICKRMWILLYRHALLCQEDHHCIVPRCSEIKVKVRRPPQDVVDEFFQKARVAAGA